jgi:hypothetical protein
VKISIDVSTVLGTIEHHVSVLCFTCEHDSLPNS